MLEPVTHTRFPGAQPFNDDALSRKLFHGRTRESRALTNQILTNRLVVLFARSGLGKTSLLNAGVAENLRAEGYLPVTARFNDEREPPVHAIRRGVQDACARNQAEYVPGCEDSLWHFFKTAEIWQRDILITPVLILDQFEEIFTLRSEGERNAFLDELSCLVRGVRPAGKASGLELTESPPPVKIVLSLREDFLAHMEELSDRIPEILDQRFRLLPLGRREAAQAMEEPAAVEDPTLTTKPFVLEDKARNAILDFLERRAGGFTKHDANHVEPFQLQLICQHLEEIAQRPRTKAPVGGNEITLDQVGGERQLRKILAHFYHRQVAAVPSFFQRQSVKRLCSEHLISPHGRRLRLEETEIKRVTRVSPETLRTLVDRRVLRLDQTADGNYYELSHDSLIAPVLSSKRAFFVLRAVLWLGICLLVIAAAVLPIASGLSTAFGAGSIDTKIIAVAFATLTLFILCRWVLRRLRECWYLWRRSRI